MKLRWIVPLHNFDCSQEIIKICKWMRLRPIGEDEKRMIRELPIALEHQTTLDTKYVLEVEEKERDPRYTNVFYYASHVIRALRLLKAGDVKTTFAFLKDGKRITRY